MKRQYKVGEIYLAYEGRKERPVLIINNGLGIDIDLTLARITGTKARNEFDVELKHWKEAGLNKPSVVRCSKITTIRPGNPLLKIGKIHEEDWQNVKRCVIEYFNKGFEN